MDISPCVKTAGCIMLVSLLFSSYTYAAKKTDIDSGQLSSAVKAAKEAKERKSLREIGPRREGEPGGCSGIDFIVKSVKITRYTDRGTIGIHAKVQNICSGSTTQDVRVVIGRTHAWIRGGFLRGQTKGVGLVWDDNAERNRSVGPITVTVNPNHEISEVAYANNTCSGTQLGKEGNLVTNYCR